MATGHQTWDIHIYAWLVFVYCWYNVCRLVSALLICCCRRKSAWNLSASRVDTRRSTLTACSDTSASTAGRSPLPAANAATGPPRRRLWRGTVSRTQVGLGWCHCDIFGSTCPKQSRAGWALEPGTLVIVSYLTRIKLKPAIYFLMKKAEMSLRYAGLRWIPVETLLLHYMAITIRSDQSQQ